MAKITPKKIIISRTDSIGDVVLTLPLAGIIKDHFRDAHIIFLGNTYTLPVINCCEHVDEVWEWAIIERWSYNEQVKWLKEQMVDTILHVFPRKEMARLAKKANIPNRVGTSHRAFHITTCNFLLNFTRKRSNWHEAQLNTKLLGPLGIKDKFTLDELYAFSGMKKIPELAGAFAHLLNTGKKNIVLHPKSRGSAVEWGVANFMTLARELNAARYHIFFTGTEKEAEQFRDQIPAQKNMTDLSGKMTLDELIAFISRADALVAASTGPLHIAAVTGIHAVGLFADVKPIHPGRWQPIGNRVDILKSKKNISDTQPLDISVRDVVQVIESR